MGAVVLRLSRPGDGERRTRDRTGASHRAPVQPFLRDELRSASPSPHGRSHHGGTVRDRGHSLCRAAGTEADAGVRSNTAWLEPYVPEGWRRGDRRTAGRRDTVAVDRRTTGPPVLDE